MTRLTHPRAYVTEEWSERLAILEDARYLKMMAEFYLHPEKPVASGLEARCYFDRASAPTEHETDERNLVLQEAGALKKLAVDYMHPERPVETTDATLFGRNYYGRASAPEQEDLEEMEERNLVLQEAGALKKLAVDYMHPELGVKTTDGSACGRNYFDRPSAHEHDRNIHTFPTHDDDEHTSHEHEHLDHFGFDEDTRHQLEDMREELHLPGAPAVIDDKDGGNLSRSPSSIMLFPGEVE